MDRIYRINRIRQKRMAVFGVTVRQERKEDG